MKKLPKKPRVKQWQKVKDFIFEMLGDGVEVYVDSQRDMQGQWKGMIVFQNTKWVDRNGEWVLVDVNDET